MHLLKRSGALTLVGVAASFLFVSCQSTQTVQDDTNDVPPVVETPVDLVRESPSESDIVKSNEAELRELEDALVAQAKSKSKAPRSLEDQAARFGARAIYLEETEEWKLRKGARSLLLKQDSRIAVLDGVKILLDAPLSRKRGNWLMSESDQRIVLASAFGDSKEIPRVVKTVVLDPGHGGLHDGAKNESIGILEKELTLDVSLRLQGHLEKMGLKVVLTRYDDRHVELADRPAKANGLKADLFVSIHFNASTNPEANGLETYMFTPEGYPSSSATVVGEDAIAYPGNALDAENFEVAYRIQKTMLAHLNREDRGVKKGRWAVLKTLTCPGVLVECGFVSDPDEALLISTAGYRERLAQSLAEAIAAYAGMNTDS